MIEKLRKEYTDLGDDNTRLRAQVSVCENLQFEYCGTSWHFSFVASTIPDIRLLSPFQAELTFKEQ